MQGPSSPAAARTIFYNGKSVWLIRSDASWPQTHLKLAEEPIACDIKLPVDFLQSSRGPPSVRTDFFPSVTEGRNRHVDGGSSLTLRKVEEWRQIYYFLLLLLSSPSSIAHLQVKKSVREQKLQQETQEERKAACQDDPTPKRSEFREPQFILSSKLYHNATLFEKRRHTWLKVLAVQRSRRWRKASSSRPGQVRFFLRYFIKRASLGSILLSKSHFRFLGGSLGAISAGARNGFPASTVIEGSSGAAVFGKL